MHHKARSGTHRVRQTLITEDQLAPASELPKLCPIDIASRVEAAHVLGELESLELGRSDNK